LGARNKKERFAGDAVLVEGLRPMGPGPFPP